MDRQKPRERRDDANEWSLCRSNPRFTPIISPIISIVNEINLRLEDRESVKYRKP